MKSFLSIILCASLSLVTQAQNTAHFKGHIEGHNIGSLVEIIQSNDKGYTIDTLKCDAKGNFDVTVEVMDDATECELGLTGSHAGNFLFLTPGMNAELDITVFTTGDRADPYDFKVNYKGDNADAFEYLNKYGSIMTFYKRYPSNKIKDLSFKEYRDLVINDVDSARYMLSKIQNTEFRQKRYKELYDGFDEKLTVVLSQESVRNDADARRWIEGIEHNDTSKMLPAYSYFWWYRRAYDVKEKDIFKELPKMFYNQDMINVFADNQIVNMLQQAPENMDQLLADYMKVSTNAEGHAKAKEVYAHYNKMRKGMPSIDFTFQNEKGKTMRLSDFRGKALYIDLWATWCGGCVAETPYMAKLYEHYKKDKRIQLISISMDRDRSLWLKKNKEDKVTWPQFIEPEEFKSDLAKAFDITFIPRFLLFDKDGKILSLNAPRPSSDDIIEWIEENISE